MIQKRKGKEKCHISEDMPIVVYGNATPLWEQLPSPPKTRPPYVTWALVKPKRQIQNDTEQE